MVNAPQARAGLSREQKENKIGACDPLSIEGFIQFATIYRERASERASWLAITPGRKGSGSGALT